jgi:Short C-terminal domain
MTAQEDSASSVKGLTRPRPRSRPPPQAPAAPAQPADMGDRIAQLKELGELLSAGVLTQAEFEQQKARILNS